MPGRIESKIYFVRRTRVVMRAFVQLRAMVATHEDVRRKIDEMEKRYDAKFHAVFATLRQMLETPVPPKRQIGFHVRTEASRGVGGKRNLHTSTRI